MPSDSTNDPNNSTPIPRPRSRDAISIAHLLNNVPEDDFVGRFPIRKIQTSPADPELDASIGDPEDSSEASHWSEEVDAYDPYVGAADTGFETFFNGLEALTFNQHVMRGDTEAAAVNFVPYGPMSQLLEPRAHEVREVLQVTAANFGTALPEASHMLQLGPAIDALTGLEVELLVNLFFQNYHRHCPVLHRPSFQPTLCPLPLLLAVMALGGMYAQDRVQVQRMRSLLDVMEAYIYGLPGLRDEYCSSFDLTVAPNAEVFAVAVRDLPGCLPHSHRSILLWQPRSEASSSSSAIHTSSRYRPIVQTTNGPTRGLRRHP